MKAKITHKLGLFTIVLFTINSILGSGIFALPGRIYQNMAGSFWIAIVISTIMAIVLTIVFSYAAKFVRKSAGAFSYVKEGLGNFWGSVVGIMKAFTTIIINATLMAAAISQIGKYIIKLGGESISHDSNHYWIGWLIAVFVYTLYTIIVSLRNRVSGGLGNVITIAKLLPIILLILVGLAVITNHTENFTDFTPAVREKVDGVVKVRENPLGPGIITGILALFYAYLGFDSLANSTESYKNPQRNIPIALGITIASLAVIYTLLLVIGIGSLPKEVIQDSSKSMLAEAAQRTVLGDFGFHFVMIGAIISMLGITFMSMYYTPQVFARMAKDGLFPKFLTIRNRAGSYPVGAVISLIVSILLTFTGGFLFLVQLNVLSRFAQFILTGLAVIVIKKRFDLKHKRKFRWTNLPTVASIISIIIMVTLLVLQFIPLNGLGNESDRTTYNKTLLRLGLSFGLFLVALFISWIYSTYNMTIMDQKKRKLIYRQDQSWQAKIKIYSMWIFAPWFMYKKTHLQNFQKYYDLERITWANAIAKDTVVIKANKFSKHYNKISHAQNEGIIEEHIYQTYLKLFTKSDISIKKISNIYIDYDDQIASYNVTFEINDKLPSAKEARIYRLFSYGNVINIKASLENI